MLRVCYTHTLTAVLTETKKLTATLHACTAGDIMADVTNVSLEHTKHNLIRQILHVCTATTTTTRTGTGDERSGVARSSVPLTGAH